MIIFRPRSESGSSGTHRSRAVRRFVLTAVLFLPTFVASAQDTVVQVATGAYHSCALVAGGRVKCWGGNYSGQLGDGTNYNRSIPVDVSGLSFPAAAVATGAFHSCALSTTGGVKCWGENSSGQLGDGTNIRHSMPVDVVGLKSGVTAVAAGESHTCALTTSGAMLCWGGNDGGVLGDGTKISRSTPRPVLGLSSGVIAIAAGAENSAAITGDGRVKYWGRNSGMSCPGGFAYCLPEVSIVSVPQTAKFLPADVSAVSIAPSSEAYYKPLYTLCALTSGGRAICWGGDIGPTFEFSGVTAIAMGMDHECMLTSGGTVECWGLNNLGQLGDSTYHERSGRTTSWLPRGLSAIAAGAQHTCVLTAWGEVWCWGANTHEQLGDWRAGDYRVVPYPVRMPTTPNYQGLWWKAPADSESGWGINFAHQGDVIFATWFTYDTIGKTWWLSMTANMNPDGTYSGTLYQTNGPAFNAVPFDPNQVTRTPVGSGTLMFSSASSGTFTYTVNGVQQTKAIVLQQFGPLPTCVWGGQPDLTKATNFQDLWWATGGAESGWGINLTQQGATIFATWFTYDVNRNPLWYSVTAPQTAPNTFTGTLYRTSGPAFSTVSFDSSLVQRTAIGTMTLTFSNGNAGTLVYQVADGAIVANQTKLITRQVFRAPGTVCQ